MLPVQLSRTFKTFCTQVKAIMLGLEPTHIMLRKELSVQQAALTQLMMHVPIL